MELHYGQSIERIIRRNGYSITELARLTSVNRRSVYNWFNQRYLKPEIIDRIARVIDYDFSTIFPSLLVNQDSDSAPPISIPAGSDSRNQIAEPYIWKEKYIALLERHNELLMEYVSKVNLDQNSLQE
jgi:transcriptional regulator with XRE-family HTH domain